jgi:hypothetical protein
VFDISHLSLGIGPGLHLQTGLSIETTTLIVLIYITSGDFFIKPSSTATLDAISAGRIMFSVDYPFGDATKGVASVESLPLSSRSSGVAASIYRGLARPRQERACPGSQCKPL